MKTMYMYICWISAIVGIVGFVLFLYGWNPVVSVAMVFVGLILAYDMSRRIIQLAPTYQDEV